MIKTITLLKKLSNCNCTRFSLFENFALIICFATFICCDKKGGVNSEKPNIVFILVDDLGYHDLGVTGSQFYETPHIDRLASQSMMFTNGYAASRVCSPSRASIMTGKFTARHGITDWIGAKTGKEWRTRNRHDKLLPADYVHSLPKEDITIAEALKEGGYKTFFAGKWHLGGKGSYPEDHGFDVNIAGIEAGSPRGGFFSPWNNPKLPNTKKGENLSMRLAEETASFIDKNTDSPFFAFLSFYAVHAPIQTTEEKWRKYRNKADRIGIVDSGYAMERILPIRNVQDNPIYAGLVETIDDAVGVVLKALKNNGLDNNTIVVFTSDNGGVASGDHYATSNLPLRGGKGYQWEGGIKEPFFIKVPWLKVSGTKSDYPVTGTDFYPTLLDLSGLPLHKAQHIDGISLKPLLEGKSFKLKRPLFWHYPHYGNQGGDPSSIIQLDGWKLIHYWEDGHKELYKLPSTEHDSLNVIFKHPQIAKQLSDRLLSWLKKVDATFPTIDPEFDKMKAKRRRLNSIHKKWPALEKNRMKVLSNDFTPNESWWDSKLLNNQ